MVLGLFIYTLYRLKNIEMEKIRSMPAKSSSVVHKVETPEKVDSEVEDSFQPVPDEAKSINTLLDCLQSVVIE